jgi:copper homeostasis protein
MSVRLEICVEGVAAAVAAAAGGADRIELCTSLAVGGLTPALCEVAEVCRLLAIPVQVLVRPRAGDFVYEAAALATMRRDIDQARALGAAGVVLGVNRADGTIDAPRVAELVARARPMSVTFHKALDELRDPLAALDELAQLGIDRVLTSGQAETARAGLPRLAALVRRAGARPVVMAGGRVCEADLPDLLAADLREIHVGSAVMTDGVTDAARVRRLVAALRTIEAEMRESGTAAS